MFDFMTHFYDVIYYVKTLGSSSKCSKKKMKCIGMNIEIYDKFLFPNKKQRYFKNFVEDILKIIFLKKRNKQEL